MSIRKNKEIKRLIFQAGEHWGLASLVFVFKRKGGEESVLHAEVLTDSEALAVMIIWVYRFEAFQLSEGLSGPSVFL